jgi:hypothetical protein
MCVLANFSLARMMMGLAEPFRGCTELRIDLLDLSLPFFFYVLAFFSRFHCTTYMTNDRNNKRMPMAIPVSFILIILDESVEQPFAYGLVESIIRWLWLSE